MRRLAALLLSGALLAIPAFANVQIKQRTVNQPLVLDQNEDYLLTKVYISGITDLAALTLTGKINSVTLDHCMFSNIWAGPNGKAVAAESQGAIVGSFIANDTTFEDAQHQLLCLREGAFGTVSFNRCKFRTSDSFLKKIYTEDPWRNSPPTTELANIERLELIDNEYTNTVLVIHPSVKLVIFRGDIANVRLASPNTHVIHLERNQDPATINNDGTAVAVKDAPADQTVATAEPVKEPAVEQPVEPVVAPAPASASNPAKAETEDQTALLTGCGKD